MALLFMMGFDYLPGTSGAGTTLASGIGGSLGITGAMPNIVSGGAAFGFGNFATCAGTPVQYPVTNSANVTTAFFGFRSDMNANTGNASNMEWIDGATPQCGLAWDCTNNQLIAYKHNTANQTVVNGVIGIGVWHYYEVKVTIDSTNGRITVLKDGVQILDTGLFNNQFTGNAYFQKIAVNNSGSGNNRLTLDDMYCCDTTASAPYNTYLGSINVQARTPTSAGASAQWTPSSGSNYAAADDATLTGATYVASSTVNNIDSYTMTALQNSPSSIYATQLLVLNEQDSAGTRQVTPLLRSGGTNYLDTAYNCSQSYAFAPTLIRTTDPATGVAWTPTGVNNCLCGEKLTN